MSNAQKHPIIIFLINVIAIILAYYVSILLHEWGHGTAAWLLGQKTSPFDVYYGGWALLHVDENVNYSQLLATHQGITAALIGVAGFTVSLLLAVFSFILLNCQSMQKNVIAFTLSYWFLIINLVPLFQYIPLTTFSAEGDIGRFIHGLNLSPWLVFIPGTVLMIFALWRLFSKEIPRAYAVIPINSLGAKRIFLLVSLIILFLLIYTHGYNPITDRGTNLYSKILAVISILLVPVLFYVCDPTRQWVKTRIATYNSFL